MNTLLVVGVLALVRPGAGPRETRGDVLTMLGSMGFLIAILWDGRIGRIDGLILLSGLVAFVAAKTGEARAGRSRAGGRDIREWILGLPSRTWLIGLFLAVGSVWLPLGARLFVDASSAIALDLGVSEAVVGLSIVALGTSLPELATAVLAARRAHLDIALGNVIGSNIFNVLAILGTAAAVAPGAISVQRHHAMWNGAVMLGAGAWLAVFLLRGRELSRLTGGLMVLAFVGWIAALYLSI